jgi:membrane protease YdiL (CAAX protease family)
MEWRWTILGVIVASAFAGITNFLLRDHSSLTGEQLFYEASLPGLAEEMAWRGLLFIFLARAYSPTNDVVSFVPAAIISTLCFGLCHGISLDNGSPNFYWLPFCYATVLGAWFAFLRIRVKSMVTLSIAHNASNICAVLASALP